MNKRTKQIYLWMHAALHDPKYRGVTIEGKFYPVDISPAGIRSIEYQGQTFIRQNLAKQTKWAKLAREGHKITWLIRPGNWGRIVDDKIEVE